MGKKFKVGKSYECANMYMGSIKVLKRYKKNIIVFDGKEEYKASVKIDNEGDEYIQNNSVTPRMKGIYTYSASWEI